MIDPTSDRVATHHVPARLAGDRILLLALYLWADAASSDPPAADDRSLSAQVCRSLVDDHGLALTRAQSAVQAVEADASRLLSSATASALKATALNLLATAGSTEAGSTSARTHLQPILDAMNNRVMVVGPDLRVLYANRALRRERGEVDGRPCHQYLLDLSAPCDHCPGIEAGSEPVSWLRLGRGEQGSRCQDVAVVAVPWDGQDSCLFHVVHDADGWKQMEQELRWARGRYQVLFDKSVSAIFVFDMQGHILDVNEQACAMSGYSRDQLCRMTVFDVSYTGPKTDPEWVARDVDETLARWREYEIGEQRTSEVLLKASDGSPIPVQVTNGPVEFGRRRVMMALLQSVAELRRMEERLTEGAAHASSIVSVLPDAIARISSDGTYRDVLASDQLMDPAVKRFYLGRRVQEIFPPEMARRTMERVNRVLETGETETFEYDRSGMGGVTWGWGEARIARLNSTEVLSLVRDITDRKLAEADRDRQHRMLSALARYSVQQTATGSMEELLRLIGDQLQELTGAPITTFSRYLPGERALALTRVSSDRHLIDRIVNRFGPGLLSMRIPVDDEIYAELQRLVVVHRDSFSASTGGSIPESVSRVLGRITGVRRFVGLAYLVDEQLLGTSLMALRDDSDLPRDEHLASYAHLTAISLRRIEAEEALRAERDAFASLVETAPGAICRIVVEPNGNVQYLYCSPDIKRIYGYSPEELRQDPQAVRERIHAADGQRVAAELREVARSLKPWTSEFRYRHPRRGLLWLEHRFAVTRQADGRTTGQGFIIDSTQRKEVEAALRESEERYRLLVDNQRDLVVKTDTDGIVLFANPAYCSFFGKTESELLGQSYMPLVHPDDHHVVKGATAALSRPPYTHTFEERALTPDGWRWLSWTTRAILGDDGRPSAFVGSGRDITGQKQAEEKLRYLSFHDGLTGLYNRRFLEQELARLDVPEQLPLSLIMVDINGLKVVNDTYGHTLGDEMLEEAAGVLAGACREDDILGRWGGDEFLLLLPRTGAREAELVCRRIESRCRGLKVGDMPLSMGLGAATRTDCLQPLAQVLQEAEDAMYRRKTTERQSHRRSVLDALLSALAVRSLETEQHVRNMQRIAALVGRRAGLPASELERLSLLVSLHDIGKVGLPEEALTRAGPLTREEWELVKKHPEVGHRIASNTPDVAHVADDILSHHERWDGGGYPRGLAREQIPFLARIVAIADAYEVMTNGRPYKQPMSSEQVRQEFVDCAGSQFDPSLVQLLLQLLDRELEDGSSSDS